MVHRQSGAFKEEPGTAVSSDHHHPHHTPQQGPPPHHLQQPRPSSIPHQQHHSQQAPPTQAQHPNPYPPHGGIPPYSQGPPTSAGQLSQDAPYYQSHPSPYSTPASSTYSSAETPEIMAAAQMGARPYPPISYHTPQPNSPASVASPSGHEQHRMYGAPQSHMQQGPPMYYTGPPQQYPPMPSHGGPSYSPHPQQHHPPMTSQQSLMMAHGPGQHPMQQHQGQHAPQQQNMTGSPRPKTEPHTGQIPGPSGPHQHQHHQHPHQQQSQSQQQQISTNGAILNKNNSPAGPGVSTAAGVNPNAAPGPIPATTPLVVRQDNNGVQWIAFEYSRDRVKMEYTIRCDVETINVDTLSSEFKTENCVYPRACCTKDQYRGNRLTYETECNSVGWALAELNPCLRGKRGLIQRAVDSWRNSNSDPRLRSRRVRRMAKISTRKAGSAATHPASMAGPGGPTGMPPSGNMGPGSTGSMGKPSMGTMGPNQQQLHHHHNHPDGNAPGGEDVGMFNQM
ncbi:putative ribosomal protein l24e [Erysiphe necator]|uniref:Putative ribosomal protein l24e n=1 Tax=Uncinula necator TaxID=52586 RepID=A0A0B1P3S9_UNCNE|nr:putative ribosomal protein l24e [Erysiphe necator]